MSPGNTLPLVHDRDDVADLNPQEYQFYSPADRRDNAELRLINYVQDTYGVKFRNYEEWYEWTCNELSLFWKSVLEFTEIKLSSNYSTVLQTDVPFEKVPKWFVGATLNYTENCLLKGRDTQAAFIQAVSGSEFKYYDYATLRNDVAAVSTALRKLGVKPSDRICGYLPNVYQTAVAMLSTAAIGAVWASASTDFGPTGVLDRFGQISPKIMFVTNMTSYKRKHHSLIHNVDKILEGLPSVEKVVVIPFDGQHAELGQFADEERYISWAELTALANPDPVLQFEQVPFDHPLLILFSSGTTGVPKGMVHTVGGTLLKHVEEHVIQTDMNSSDTILFYTTCGWMMWNWLMTVLYTGATIVLYDESPLEPDPHVLIKVAQNTKSTIMGMGAKVWDELAKQKVDFKTVYDISNLRLALSTASPLKAATFNFMNENLKPKLVIGSISGGTDIVGCFMGASLNCAVVPGECQHFYLGMKMAAYQSEEVHEMDEQGELVCQAPFPSMPSHFIKDPTGERYFNAYFNKYPGVWTHGDYCVVNSKTNGITIFGRSDTTLNRGGVRIGTAEIYNVVDKLDVVNDSIVVGKTDPKDPDNEHIVLFLKLNEGVELCDNIKFTIKKMLRLQMSPRHIPNEIYAVSDIPYTNSGKKVEMAVKQVIHRQPVKNINSLRNPESLELFKPYSI
uniref:Acetoacetyl-CoA synthetase n=1 Tax=Panagrellus redivivus TaxID=6233 RepID=A0A7E4ULW7_PANRE